MSSKYPAMLTSRSVVLDIVGEFTWDFGQRFFIESPGGNFIWKDPGYDGDNTLTYTPLSYDAYAQQTLGRSKGYYKIRDRCGESVRIIIEGVELHD